MFKIKNSKSQTNCETIGRVVSVTCQRWLKINTKPVRSYALDGAAFPHVLKIEYTANGKTYVKRKWLGAGMSVPCVGSSVKLIYREGRPDKARISSNL